MNEEVNKKTENWFNKIGKEKFFSFSAELEKLVQNIETIFSDESFLAAVEGEVISVCSSSTTKEQFFTDIAAETSFYEIEDFKAQKIKALLERFISDHDSLMTPEEENTQKSDTLQKTTIAVPTPGDILANLQKNLTQGTVIAPTTREHGTLKEGENFPVPTSSVPQEKKFDPYREQI